MAGNALFIGYRMIRKGAIEMLRPHESSLNASILATYKSEP